MPAVTDSFILSNEVEIPRIGFGTWQIPDGPVAYDAVAAALDAGYRHIDTARAYGNEASVGRAIRDSGISREEIFVTTKLPAEVKSGNEAAASFETTISALSLDYVDLYLIHAPWPWSQMGKDCRAGNIEVWREFEKILADGRSRSIGVSNFDPADLKSLIAATDVIPHVNQIRYFVGYTQEETVDFCRERDILVEGYSPLATGAILDNDNVRGIAAKYGKSVAQICIRFLLEKNILPLPKTTSPKRMTENADVDFTISSDDLKYLDALTDTAP
jgi:diketogulonate reductase-like aldo/keto reductase